MTTLKEIEKKYLNKDVRIKKEIGLISLEKWKNTDLDVIEVIDTGLISQRYFLHLYEHNSGEFTTVNPDFVELINK